MELDNFATLNQTSRHMTKTSERYAFIPTTRALGVLQDFGWHPQSVSEASTRIDENRGFQKHLLRLRNETMPFVNGHAPEIVLVNSHMGSASFRLMFGVFRMVCSNGLIAGDTVRDYRITHKGYADDAVADAIKELMLAAPQIANSIESLNSVHLTNDQKMAYAKAAIELKYDDETKSYGAMPEDLVRPLRYQEAGNDSLWQTFNTVQERLVKGRHSFRNANGAIQKARAVKSIDENTRLNRALWTLADEMKRLAA